MAWSQPGREGVAERGGLGRDPSAAPSGEGADQGDQPATAPEPEHGPGGDPLVLATAVRAAADAVRPRPGGRWDPGAAARDADDARYRHRGTHRLGSWPDGAQGSRAGAAAAVSAARSGGPHDLSARRARTVGPLVPAGRHPAGLRPCRPTAGHRRGLGLLTHDRGPHDPDPGDSRPAARAPHLPRRPRRRPSDRGL